MSLRIRREGRLLRITLDRADKRNALNSQLCRDMVAALDDAESGRGIGAALLDAEGSVFCAGMDLEESLLPDAAERNAIHERLFTMGARLHKPLVAAVQGPAIAGGVGLVANAHIVVASEDATFSLPEIRIGMWPYVVWRSVVAAVGERRAVELSLTGRTFAARDALAWGLVHQLAPRDAVVAQAETIARRLAEASAETVRRGMSLVHDSRDMTVEEAVKLAATLRARQFRSADYAEGVRAFREKREPRWPSHQEPDSE